METGINHEIRERQAPLRRLSKLQQRFTKLSDGKVRLADNRLILRFFYIFLSFINPPIVPLSHPHTLVTGGLRGGEVACVLWDVVQLAASLIVAASLMEFSSAQT